MGQGEMEPVRVDVLCHPVNGGDARNDVINEGAQGAR